MLSQKDSLISVNYGLIDILKVSDLTFGWARELSSWYLIAVGMLVVSISFSVLGGSASTDAGPDVEVACFTSVGSTDWEAQHTII